MALSILLHPPTALWRREALAASRGTFWVRMDGASSLRIYNGVRSHVGRRSTTVNGSASVATGDGTGQSPSCDHGPSRTARTVRVTTAGSPSSDAHLTNTASHPPRSRARIETPSSTGAA